MFEQEFKSKLHELFNSHNRQLATVIRSTKQKNHTPFLLKIRALNHK